MLLSLSIFSAALVFRVATGAPALHEATVGSTWRFDFHPALDLASGYGAVRDAPPALLNITPVSSPQPLAGLTKPFDPIRYSKSPYPSTLRPGAYAGLSALAMKATGTTSIRPLLDLQIVLDSLVAVFVFAILLELTSPFLALAGAALSVFWFPQAASSSVYYATALVPFLLTLTLWLFLRGARNPRAVWFGAVGVTSAALVYLRPELLFLPLLLSAYLFFLLRRVSLRTVALALLPLLIVGTAVLGRSLRNGAKTGYYAFTSQTGAAFWEGMGYQSGLFPEYTGFYNDERIRAFLPERGIQLRSTTGNFYDGPMGMEANTQLTRLFIDEVVKPHPGKLLGHLVFKLHQNFMALQNWQDAVNEFAAPRRAGYAPILARWMDFAILILPFVCLAKIDWRDPRHRLIGIFLIPLLSTHAALALTVAGPLRYTVLISPCYPILAAGTVWLLAGGRPVIWKASSPGSILAVAGTAAVAALAVMSLSWPAAPAVTPVLDLDLMPIESSTRVVVSDGSGAILAHRSSSVETNLAAGRRVEFGPVPNYPVLTEPDDPIQLTDGIVDSTYHTPKWVGWGMNAPSISITVPMDAPHFVTRIRVHTFQSGFPISSIHLYEGSGGQRTLLASSEPPAPSPTAPTRIGWIEFPVGKVVVRPIIGVNPTKINDTYLFLDEIEVLGTTGFESQGEILFGPVRLARKMAGIPVLTGKFPPGSRAELSYRRAGAKNWQTSGWDAAFFEQPIQFRVVLNASADGVVTPVVQGIGFSVR